MGVNKEAKTRERRLPKGGGIGLRILADNRNTGGKIMPKLIYVADDEKTFVF